MMLVVSKIKMHGDFSRASMTLGKEIGHTPRDTPYRAIVETEMLTDWLEKYMLAAWQKCAKGN